MSNLVSLWPLENLRIVVLESPYEMFHRQAVNQLFIEMVQMKIRGYQSEYPHFVLPIDTTDFVGTHLLACRQHGETLKPLMGFKTTSMSVCEKHRIAFPGLGLAQAARAPVHVKAVEKLMQSCSDQKAELSYTGGWTMDPEIRKNRPVAKKLNELFNACYFFYHTEVLQSQIITGGTPRFKTEKLVQWMGHEPLRSVEDEELPCIHVRHLFDEEVKMMRLKKFSVEMENYCKELKPVWDNRLHFNAAAWPSELKKSG